MLYHLSWATVFNERGHLAELGYLRMSDPTILSPTQRNPFLQGLIFNFTEKVVIVLQEVCLQLLHCPKYTQLGEFLESAPALNFTSAELSQPSCQKSVFLQISDLQLLQENSY